MMKTYYLGKMVAFSLVVLAVCAFFKPAYAYEQAVQPTMAAPGSVFAFFTTGFDAYEKVTFWANDPSGNVYTGGEVWCNQFNRVDWTWQSPSDAQYGRWSMVAYGHKSHIERVIFFEVGDVAPGQNISLPAGQDTNLYDSAITPREGAPGTTFHIFAKGFREYERVVFWVNDPLGNVYEIGAFGTNEFGRVDWEWESPSDMLPGQWTFVAHGDLSHVERVMHFAIHPVEEYPELAEPVDAYDSAVTPARGVPGTRFLFFASNFTVGESVAFVIVAPDGTIQHRGEKHASKWERIDWEWRSPDDAPPGIWTARATGLESQIEQVIHFEIYRYVGDKIVPTPPDPYDSAVFPAEGPPGTTFAFFATGYVYEERVEYQCIAPDGEVHSVGQVKSSEFGRADWQCQSPYTASSGIWTTVARGTDSQITRVLNFTIR